MIINTSGIGRRSPLLDGNLSEARRYRDLSSDYLLDSNVRPGDKIILSGPIADHGIAIISYREGYGFESDVESDCAPLNELSEAALGVGGVVDMKDPTRGGLANCLNEISQKSRVSIVVREERIPINPPTKAACDMLGLDPLEIGNEGKMVLCVVKERAEEVLEAIKEAEDGRNATIIGEAKEGDKVIMETRAGGKRIIDKPYGDPIPRIC
jgi:hydrogenase expression/formation protein HypE